MDYVIKTGKTIDEAVSEALKELNISKQDAQIEVLEEAQKGFLGIIGNKDATVKVSKKSNTNEILEEIFNDKTDELEKSQENLEIENNEFVEELNTDVDLEFLAKEFLGKVLKSLEVEANIEINREENHISVNIDAAEDKLGIIIGKRGQTLDSIAYILNLILNRNSKIYIRTTLDCNGYREKREQTLSNLALKMADKVLNSNKSIRLEPMNAYERKLIHTALQDVDGVITHSEGKDPYRRVVIKKERKY